MGDFSLRPINTTATRFADHRGGQKEQFDTAEFTAVDTWVKGNRSTQLATHRHELPGLVGISCRSHLSPCNCAERLVPLTFSSGEYLRRFLQLSGLCSPPRDMHFEVSTAGEVIRGVPPRWINCACLPVPFPPESCPRLECPGRRGSTRGDDDTADCGTLHRHGTIWPVGRHWRLQPPAVARPPAHADRGSGRHRTGLL